MHSRIRETEQLGRYDHFHWEMIVARPRIGAVEIGVAVYSRPIDMAMMGTAALEFCSAQPSAVVLHHVCRFHEGRDPTLLQVCPSCSDSDGHTVGAHQKCCMSNMPASIS